MNITLQAYNQRSLYNVKLRAGQCRRSQGHNSSQVVSSFKQCCSRLLRQGERRVTPEQLTNGAVQMIIYVTKNQKKNGVEDA